MEFSSNELSITGDIFYLLPSVIDRNSSKDLLSYALGATLYMPATKANIGESILLKKHTEHKSMVICFEDAIGDSKVIESEIQLLQTLQYIQSGINKSIIDYQSIPFVFIRIRNCEQLERLSQIVIDYKDIITGFVIPKITSDNAISYLEACRQISIDATKTFYVMPILETSKIIYKETRIAELSSLRNVFNNYSDSILNIRLGGTDFSKYFGLRRNYSNTIYDLCVVRDCISDITNFFLREDNDYVISAPVWEYFSSNNSDICEYSQGLIRELLLDKANGLIGKTIIHPSQASIVNALFTVEYKEYFDALSILSTDANNLGAVKSDFSNKMNEIKPHFNWASKIIKRANVYGVFNHGFNYKSII